MTEPVVASIRAHRRPWALDVAVFLTAGATILALGAMVPDGLIDRLWLPLRTLGFLALLTWLLRRAGETWRDLGLHRPRPWWRATGVWLFGYLLIAVVGTLLIHVVLPALGWLVQATTAFTHLRGDFAEYFYWLIIAWACAAIGEELAFRGFLLVRLERLFGGPEWTATTLALLVQAIVFGLSHGYQGPGGMLVSGVTGLILGAVYLASGRNLVVCILLHGLVDTISLTVLFMGIEL